MAQVLYGFQIWNSPTINVNEQYPAIGKNSEVFTAGDPVVAGSTSGAIVVVNGSTGIIGIAAKTVTMSSTNQTVAKVKVPIIPIDQDYVWLAGCQQDLGATAVGQIFPLNYSSTGALQVDSINNINVSTNASGQEVLVVCVGTDPYGFGDTGAASGARQGLFKFVRAINKGLG